MSLDAQKRVHAERTLRNIPPAPRELPPRLLAGNDDAVRRMAVVGLGAFAGILVGLALFVNAAAWPLVLGAVLAGGGAAALHFQPRMRARQLAFVRDGVGVIGAVGSVYEKVTELENSDGGKHVEWRVSFSYLVGGASYTGDERIMKEDAADLERAGIIPLVVDKGAPARHAIYLSALDV